MGVGENLKKLLSKKGMTIKGLSETTGISINTLYSITKRDNKNVHPDILNKISEVLDISSDGIFQSFEEICQNQNEAHEISEYILNNPTIEKDSKVGRIVNGYKFQGCIHDLIRGLLKKDEKEKDWLILTVQRLLELDRKYALTFNQLDDILFVIDSISSALSTDNPEMFEHITNVIKIKLEEIRTDQKNKANTNKERDTQ